MMKGMLIASALLIVTPAAAAAVPGSMAVHWIEGAQDCTKNAEPPLQVNKYNSGTFILRENPCATFEAPFLYLLIGDSRAMLIDTGDVADAGKMPLAKTVMALLPANLPLLVVHTHRHMDHRAGDGQFAHLRNVQVVGYAIDSVKQFYGFAHWPDGVARIDLGRRVVNVVPTPGHDETEVSFYDRNTTLFFSGDFMMPGRLLVEDASAEIASARRVASFVTNRPVVHVLGGHVEENDMGELYPWETSLHPREHALEMTKADLFALPAAAEAFNGFYSADENFVMIDSMRLLYLFAIVALAVVIALISVVIMLIRRRKRRAERLRA